jgi:hypothetical protein
MRRLLSSFAVKSFYTTEILSGIVFTLISIPTVYQYNYEYNHSLKEETEPDPTVSHS